MRLTKIGYARRNAAIFLARYAHGATTEELANAFGLEATSILAILRSGATHAAHAAHSIPVHETTREIPAWWRRLSAAGSLPERTDFFGLSTRAWATRRAYVADMLSPPPRIK